MELRTLGGETTATRRSTAPTLSSPTTPCKRSPISSCCWVGVSDVDKPFQSNNLFKSLMVILCPRLKEVYIYATVPVPDTTLEFLGRLIAPQLTKIYVICEGGGVW